ncbi:MAG TPA: rhomboid family intramembrane serine protease [Flavipsychrobacter sp.]|nr:rhomboid family intramembrane serine protease [Flavipsychrobacter sp.]
MTDFRPSRFQILPTVVKNLLIINSLMALLQFVLLKFNIDLADHLGLHYWRSPLYKPWQLITHMFMHGSAHDVNLTIMHLFSNMFALWMFGSILENMWGAKRFLTFYLVCGLGAALLHLGVLGYEFNVFENAFYNYQQNIGLDKYLLFVEQNELERYSQFTQLSSFWQANPGCSNCSSLSVDLIKQYYTQSINQATVGASGAVFGILFAFGYLFPNTLLYIYFLFPIKAKYVVAAYALFELFSGIRNSAGDNIAHFAHLGGMVVAFIILKIWNRNVRNKFY